MTRPLLPFVGIVAFAAVCAAQEPDIALMAYINQIRAIDNHAHVVSPDLEHDKGYDALPCEALGTPTGPPPAGFRFNAELQLAWRALYTFNGTNDAPETIARWQAAQKAVRDKQGAAYPEWVANQAGIETILANRLSMTAELTAPRFRWVPYDDALLFPLNNATLKAQSPDRKGAFENEERLLREYLAARGASRPPPTLDAYLQKVVGATLDAQKAGGAVALKFEVAYLRALDFQPASQEAAADIYARAIASGTPPPIEDYKELQDFLFHEIAARAGRLGLAIHIHTGLGCGEYFDTRGSDPLLLEPTLNDPSLRSTKFVLLHGSSPFDRSVTALIAKPNVWVDTSVLALLYSPPELARILRPWLEVMPEHVLFGTDAGPFGPGQGWEETTWMAARKTRRALGLVLSQMMREGVAAPPRAREIAEGVLRRNAMDLYGWK